MPTLLANLAPHLPYVQRYARAVTGDSSSADQLVRLVMEKLAVGESSLRPELAPRVALYRAFEEQLAAEPARAVTRRDGRLNSLDAQARRAFLLTAVEGFSPADTADILDANVSKIHDLIISAQRAIDAELRARVLVIEDEPVIAQDLSNIARAVGHEIVGIAATRSEALEIARRTKNLGLVLADIQLADGSSGIEAVRDIQMLADVPAIFITAFPERLLTGERPEPSFLITKPYQPEVVTAAIGQALFFHHRGDKAPDFNESPSIVEEVHHSKAVEVSEPPQSPQRAKGSVNIQSVRTRPDMFAPRTRALSIEVVDGVAFLPTSAVDVAFPLSTLERLAKRLLAEIQRVSGREELHNHRALTDRLDGLAVTLSGPVQASTALVITAQARAIAGAAARALAEELIDDPARDVAILIEEINDFVREFSAVHEALKSNSALPAISDEAGRAMIVGAQQIEGLPDTAATPELKASVRRIREAFEDGGDLYAGNILYRFLTEYVLAVGRWLMNRGFGIGSEAGKFVEKAGGKIVGGAIVSVPFVAALEVLRVYYPDQFAFVPTLRNIISALLK